MDSSDLISFHSTLNHLALNPTSVNKEELNELHNGIREVMKVFVGLQKLGQAEDLRSSGLKWLRSLKSLLLCLTKLVDEPSSLSPLLSRIEDAIMKIPEAEGPPTFLTDASTHMSAPVVNPGESLYRYSRRIEDAVANIPCIPSWSDIHSLGKGVDVCFTNILPNELINQGDEFGPTTCSFLETALDFMYVAQKYMNPFRKFRPAEVEVIDGFEVQITLLKNFLLFAVRAGVEPDQLQNLLLRIQPLAIIAARVYIARGVEDRDSFEEVQSKCSEVNRLATDSQLYQACSRALKTSKLSSKQTHMDNDDHHTFDIFKNFADSLISLLWDMLRVGADPSEHIKALYEWLWFLRSVLKHIAKSSDEKMRDQIGVMLCDAGVFIFSLHQIDGETSDLILSELLGRFDASQTAFENLVSHTSESSSTKANELDFDGNEKEGLQKEAAISSLQSSQSTTHTVDFQADEVSSVLQQLIRGSKQLCVVPIFGMVGIGKTTFALELYNHPSVKDHFHSRAWCTISQVMDKKKVLGYLLKQSQPGNYSGMTEDDLANILRQSLKEKRYLILLDDVWTPEVLSSLAESFPDDYCCSRIILTSRNHGIAPALPDAQPHSLRLRTDEECFQILGMKLSHKEGWIPKVGKEIAILCKGLPLTVVIVAGLLVTMGKEDWNGILGALSSGSVSIAEKCKIALELSYKHMPNYLKPCFLYFGAFPEDHEVSMQRMSTLWIAEGFVRENESKRRQDVAREYLEKLIERSVVMVAKSRSTGGVKTFRIHDLLHDFCRTKAKEENLFHLLLQGHDQVSGFRFQ